MAKTDTETVNPTTSEENWEDISVGIGREHDPEDKGPLTGIFERTEVIDVEDKETHENRPTNAHVFDVDGEQLFIWGGYYLDKALEDATAGTKYQITFVGRDNFTGDKGPQQIKNYRVQRAGPAASA